MKPILKKKILKFEKAFEVKPEHQYFWVLIRRKPCFIIDSIGSPLGRIVHGQPTDADFYTIWTSEAEGPFKTEAEAKEYLETELSKMRKADPSRFTQIEKMSQLIKRPQEVK